MKYNPIIYSKINLSIQDKSIDQFEQCSNQMVILFKPKLIRLFNLKTKTDESAESPESVHKLFLDPSGKHLIVSTESNELYYYSRATKKFKSISLFIIRISLSTDSLFLVYFILILSSLKSIRLG